MKVYAGLEMWCDTCGERTYIPDGEQVGQEMTILGNFREAHQHDHPWGTQGSQWNVHAEDRFVEKES